MEWITSLLDAALGLSARNVDLTVAQICARAFIVYLALIVYVRMGKKRFLGEATAFDAIVVITIGSLASRGIAGDISFGGTLAAVYLLVALHWIISYLAQKSAIISNLTKGHDTKLIRNGRVNRKNLRDAHMSDDDLAEDLRMQGVANVSQVQEARLERGGKVSVIKK